jgi:predicted GNAT superfamily acetyltransferase
MTTPQKKSPDITYRHCESESDYAACEALQAATWGDDDIVPMTFLTASQEIGGVLVGAFNSSNRMLGLVFGTPGIREGRLMHWSHMLAVVPEARGLGLGYGLKMFQRDALATAEFDEMFWTYDPLESINAHLNINRLGARPVEYVENVYGDGSANLLHQGLGTDRFVVRWAFKKQADAGGVDGAKDAPVLNGALGEENDISIPVDARCVRVEGPRDIQALKIEQPDQAAAWRRSTREAFQLGLEGGYAVTGFHRADDGRCFYIMETER